MSLPGPLREPRAWGVCGGHRAGGEAVTAQRPGPVWGLHYPGDDLGRILVDNSSLETGLEEPRQAARAA